MRSIIALVLAATLNAAPAQEIRDAVQAVVDAGAPAAVLAIRTEKGVEDVAAGVADTRTGRPAKAGDRYRIASITKTFTARPVVVLQLVAEHKIGLDEPIGRYLEGVPSGSRVTVRDLLRHTSGLPDFYDALGLKTSADWQRRRLERLTDDRRLSLAFRLPATEPGSREATYSNINYVLLGKLVERVTGDTYAGQVARRVVRPLRLRDTYYADGQAAIRDRHLHGYLPADLPGKPDADFAHLVDFTTQTINQSGPAGSMISTVDELTQVYRALFNGKLLPPALMKEMTATVPVRDNPMPWVQGFGLGVHRYDLGCGPVYGHIGGVRGYTGIVVSTLDGRRQAAARPPSPSPSTRIRPRCSLLPWGGYAWPTCR
ncbi:serine hydrolase domain-containing protein [Nonomuraea sp. NPDC049625]|uniref:serine hydrolase domain-containing protein n=1 Tax=Nonomuraea sp. NPDC049625 TaxID=3155775 RepID=UPI00343DA7F1